MTKITPEVVVIGGGPAGMFAAINSAMLGNSVTLIEQNSRLGKKLSITGKGRCNVTNNCDLQAFLSNVPTNPKFLYTALTSFSTSDTISFFEECGVPLKTERGDRVFPESDKASDIVRALESKCRSLCSKIVKAKVASLTVENGKVKEVKCTDGNILACDFVILATGGLSYPLTGSDGSGYALATRCGHTLVEPKASLVPIEAYGGLCKRLQGLSLKNVSIKFKERNTSKILYTDFGEMMFTHFGITGPTVLSASSYIRRVDYTGIDLVIDLKPALDHKTLDKRILSDFAKNANKDFVNSLGALLPLKLIDPIVSLSGIDPRKKVNTITKEERHSLIEIIKNLSIPLKKVRPIDEAIITSGGIDTKEIDPKTMESKLVKGLFFAGEMIDVDAYTGGFNLQIAFSTGYLAAQNAGH